MEKLTRFSVVVLAIALLAGFTPVQGQTSCKDISTSAMLPDGVTADVDFNCTTKVLSIATPEFNKTFLGVTSFTEPQAKALSNAAAQVHFAPKAEQEKVHDAVVGSNDLAQATQYLIEWYKASRAASAEPAVDENGMIIEKNGTREQLGIDKSTTACPEINPAEWPESVRKMSEQELEKLALESDDRIQAVPPSEARQIAEENGLKYVEIHSERFGNDKIVDGHHDLNDLPNIFGEADPYGAIKRYQVLVHDGVLCDGEFDQLLSKLKSGDYVINKLTPYATNMYGGHVHSPVDRLTRIIQDPVGADKKNGQIMEARVVLTVNRLAPKVLKIWSICINPNLSILNLRFFSFKSEIAPKPKPVITLKKFVANATAKTPFQEGRVEAHAGDKTNYRFDIKVTDADAHNVTLTDVFIQGKLTLDHECEKFVIGDIKIGKRSYFCSGTVNEIPTSQPILITNEATVTADGLPPVIAHATVVVMPYPAPKTLACPPVAPPPPPQPTLCDCESLTAVISGNEAFDQGQPIVLRPVVIGQNFAEAGEMFELTVKANKNKLLMRFDPKTIDHDPNVINRVSIESGRFETRRIGKDLVNVLIFDPVPFQEELTISDTFKIYEVVTYIDDQCGHHNALRTALYPSLQGSGGY